MGNAHKENMCYDTSTWTSYLCHIMACFLCVLTTSHRKREIHKYKEDDRKCHVCSNDDIENEFHFLCVYNAYIKC